MRRRQNIFQLVVMTVLAVTAAVRAPAQVSPTPPAVPSSPSAAPSPQRKSRILRRPVAPVVVDDRVAARQVVTILHRINGLKMFRLLLRANEGIGAITKLDEAFTIKDDVHTNVIAGLAMDDGETIAVRLPEVDAELGPVIVPAAPSAPQAPNMAFPQVKGVHTALPGQGLLGGAGSFFDRPDITVIGRNGKRLVARYIGLDGASGLSVLKLAGLNAIEATTAKELTVRVGQRIRLLGPEPVEQTDAETPGTIYVRMGETEAQVVGVTKAPSGTTARIRISAEKLSPASVGGIAINDAGEAVGIVEVVENNEATLLPNALVRSAAKRVLQRQASVPRPWLGIRGEAIGTMAFDQMLRGGWQADKAMSLVQQHRGILLTSVAPGSPAAFAALRPGDVILSVNEGDVKDAADFSWSLEEVGAGNSANFVVARPGNTITEAVAVKLSDAPMAFIGSTNEEIASEVEVERFFRPQRSGSSPNLSALLMSQGIETIALKAPVAARFGAGSGLLVVYVGPQSEGFKAGLRSGDVIEKINGRSVLSSGMNPTLHSGSSYSLNVVRNKDKLVIKIKKLTQER